MKSCSIPGVIIHDRAKIIGIENIKFGQSIIIDDFVFIYAKNRLVIGNHAHIACATSIIVGGEITIGDFCGISHGCRIFSRQDDFKDWGFGNPTIPEKYRNTMAAPVRIGRFVVIGANSVVLSGVEIGEGVSVGACSVVTKNLEPWGIYIGNKRIGERNRRGILDNYRRFQAEAGVSPGC